MLEGGSEGVLEVSRPAKADDVLQFGLVPPKGFAPLTAVDLASLKLRVGEGTQPREITIQLTNAPSTP